MTTVNDGRIIDIIEKISNKKGSVSTPTIHVCRHVDML